VSDDSLVSVCPVYSVSTDNILKQMCEGESLKLTMCAHYSWEMALNIRPDVPFNDM
jgi:hypothetical protein